MSVTYLCSVRGCFTPKPCEKHQRDERRKDTKTDAERKFYSSARWTRVSRQHRVKEPLCREHMSKGLIVPAAVTDHIVSMRNGGSPWDEDNFQSLCEPCHRKKSREEQEARRGTQ